MGLVAIALTSELLHVACNRFQVAQLQHSPRRGLQLEKLHGGFSLRRPTSSLDHSMHCLENILGIGDPRPS